MPSQEGTGTLSRWEPAGVNWAQSSTKLSALQGCNLASTQLPLGSVGSPGVRTLAGMPSLSQT